MGDYFGVPNMANIPNPSEWKHADTAKAWAEKANNAEAHVEAMVKGLDIGLETINSNLARVNTRLEEVSGEIESQATSASESATSASESATSAATSASSASISATNAATSATSASTSASSAESAKATVQAAVLDAISAKNTAVSSATTATTAATSASTSATSASESAETAQLYATNAAATAQTVNSAVEEAEEYAEAAESSAARAQARYVDADNSATAAQTSANAAAATAASVTQYVQAASASAAQAETAASNANTYKTAAAGSAITASTAATTATTKASEASESADDAAESATASSTSATAAADSATAAASSATAASTSATNAATSATAAASSASDAEDAATRAEAAAEIAEVHIEDNLTSDNSLHVLSAKQGKVLKGLIDNIPIVPVVDNFNSTSSTSALSANKGKELNDLFNGTIHHDHRVRVHINLPYKDHMDDEWNHNLVISGQNQLGFSGANLCPDSDYQYGSVNRYGGVTGNYFLRRGINNALSSTHKYLEGDSFNTMTNCYNVTDGKTNWSTTNLNTAIGRIHTGWASFIIPGICSSITNASATWNSYNSYNIDSHYKTQLLVPYTKTFVPACSDITEDATSYMQYLNDATVPNMMYLMSTQHKYMTPCNSIGVQYNSTQFVSTNTREAYSDLYSNIMSYVLPASVNIYTSSSNYTTVDNPFMEMYAGLKLQSPMGSANTARTPFNVKNKLSHGWFDAIYSSRVNGTLDQFSLGRPNHWHDNPILPYTPVIENNDMQTCNNAGSDCTASSFASRFVYKNGSRTNYNGFNPHMVLGIRYFDATAQEWRVFSPGDNCSYGYDGTHWNYREYLWVDLDKPVTYIVGGVRASSTAANGASLTILNRTATPYDHYSYGGTTVSSSWTGNSSVPQCDLIHVETPNYDNHTSYSKWRQMTLMTVDYSSSPLNYNNTVYCADSSYGAEDSGSLDMTKVSCMYSGSYNGASGFVDYDYNNYSTLATSGNLVFPGTNVVSGSGSNERKYIDYCGLFIGNNSSISGKYCNLEGSNLEHSCYHIRIGLES